MKTNRDRLFLFFKGELSPEEEAEIIEWAEESEENYASLQEERMIFDMINLADDSVLESPKVRRFSFSWKMAAVAASLVAVISSALLLARPHAQVDMLAQTCITAPSGTRSQVTLPDGTQVWLNSGSTMKYSAFPQGKGKREVVLDGQARFDVSKDAEHPFVVHTYLADIEVLGTSFDVIADSGRNRFETALFEGRVNVSQQGSGKGYVLEPSQKLSYSGSEMRIGAIENYDIYSWVDGLYSFRDKPFSQILADMENYYDVRINCKIDLNKTDEALTGKFRLNDGLDYALRLLQISTGFHYTYSDDKETVTITR